VWKNRSRVLEQGKTKFGDFISKKAKLSASELAEIKVGKGEEDSRCKRLLTVYQKRRGLSEDGETIWE